MKFCTIVLSFIVSLSILTPVNANESIPDWSQHSELTNAPIAQGACWWAWCPRDAAYELALEKEYWRHVQHEDQAGMKAWLDKTLFYTQHWMHRNEYLTQKGRLWMLASGGHLMIFNQYNLHDLIPIANGLLEGRIGELLMGLSDGFDDIPALYHMAESIRLSLKANHQISDHHNAQAFLLGVGAFVQLALPESDITGEQAAFNTLYGPSCENFPFWLKLVWGDACSETGLMGPGEFAYLDCVDKQSCDQISAGTEGLVAGALTQALMNDDAMIQNMLTMLGDNPDGDEIANCDSFWCAFLNENNKSAAYPQASSIAPFKRVVLLLSIAETYARLGKFEKMERALAQGKAAAVAINWPFMERLEEIEIGLHGGDEARGIEDLVERWNNPDPERDFIGKVQLPLPVTGRHCNSCHFAGVMNKTVVY